VAKEKLIVVYSELADCGSAASLSSAASFGAHSADRLPRATRSSKMQRFQDQLLQ
jgi:hypothetical protein